VDNRIKNRVSVRKEERIGGREKVRLHLAADGKNAPVGILARMGAEDEGPRRRVEKGGGGEGGGKRRTRNYSFNSPIPKGERMKKESAEATPSNHDLKAGERHGIACSSDSSDWKGH